ncbi:hypothetical protein TWF173_001736 [Orbilia oligospora]|nr:hypothetical protein TWF173_001736 [Orbilia oligospora]
MADSKHADAVRELIEAQKAGKEQSKDLATWRFIAYAFAGSDSEANKIIGGGAYLISDYKLNHSVKEARAYIQSNLDEPSYRARAGGIIDGVDQTISGLGKLQQSAEEFYKIHTEEAAEYEKFKIWE